MKINQGYSRSSKDGRKILNGSRRFALSTFHFKILIKTLGRSSTINRTSNPTWKPPRNCGSNLVSALEQWIQLSADSITIRGPSSP